MKKILSILLILSALAISGCSTTTFDATKLDGTKVHVRNIRILWTTDDYAATIGTNSASLTASKSKTDSQSLGTIVTAAVQGAVQGAK